MVFKTSGSTKERTQTSTEMGISCQRNGHWAATNHLSSRGLVQPLSTAARRCAGRGCALIRQIVNSCGALFSLWKQMCSLQPHLRYFCEMQHARANLPN